MNYCYGIERNKIKQNNKENKNVRYSYENKYQVQFGNNNNNNCKNYSKQAKLNNISSNLDNYYSNQ